MQPGRSCSECGIRHLPREIQEGARFKVQQEEKELLGLLISLKLLLLDSLNRDLLFQNTKNALVPPKCLPKDREAQAMYFVYSYQSLVSCTMLNGIHTVHMIIMNCMGRSIHFQCCQIDWYAPLFERRTNPLYSMTLTLHLFFCLNVDKIIFLSKLFHCVFL